MKKLKSFKKFNEGIPRDVNYPPMWLSHFSNEKSSTVN